MSGEYDSPMHIFSMLSSEKRSPSVSTIHSSMRSTSPHLPPLYGAAKVHDADYKQSNVASFEALSSSSHLTVLPLLRAREDIVSGCKNLFLPFYSLILKDDSHESERSCETETTCVDQVRLLAVLSSCANYLPLIPHPESRDRTMSVLN